MISHDYEQPAREHLQLITTSATGAEIMPHLLIVAEMINKLFKLKDIAKSASFSI